MKKLNKRLIAAFLAIVIAISGFSGYLAYNSYAARTIDESKTVSFAQFSARHSIPNTTIFIGTHLIALECATDELWKIAVDSQIASEQMDIYYKSELAGGIWYDITDAESLSDITVTGTAVNPAELADLRVMYYTFDYGLTKLAINDRRHCIFDGDYDYWDLYHLDELQSIRDQYDIIVSRNNEKSEMDKFYRQFLGDFFRMGVDLKSQKANEADDALYALQDIYDALVEAERKEDADIIYKLMAKLDNLRRSEIFKQLIDEDYSLYMDYLTPWLYKNYRNVLDEVLQKCGGEGYPVFADDEDADFTVNNAVVNAIGTDIGECQKSYLEKLSNILEPNGSRIIDGLIYETSKKIIDTAKGAGVQDLGLFQVRTTAELTPEMDEDIIRLGHLFNIDDKLIVNKDEELYIVDNELLDQVTDKFSGNALTGPTEDYVTALNAGASDAALSGMLDKQESELDFIRLELQDVITAKVDRTDVEEAMAFVYDRILLSEDMKNAVPSTDFAGNATAQIKRHIKWLSDLLAVLYELSNTGESELDKLKKKADSLLLKQQQAYDSNDFRKAKEYDEARKVVLDQIDNMMARLTDTINDPNANAGDKALAQSVLDGGNDGMDKLLQGIVNDALDKQNKGEDISDEVDLLSSLGYTDGLDQLGVSDGGDGDGNGDGNGNGDLNGFGISADALLGLLAGILGDINSLSDDQLAGAIRALEIIYDMGYEGAGTLAARLANIAVTKGNKYLYSQINDSGDTEFVNIATLAWVADFRYAYDNSKRTGTLIGSNVKPTYQFAAGDSTVYEAVNRDSTNPRFRELSKMSTIVRLYADRIYSPVVVCDKYFNSVACHIKKSDLGICITSKMEGEARSLVNQLLPLIQGAN